MQVCEAGSTLAQRCVVVCPCVQYFYNQVFLLFVPGLLLLVVVLLHFVKSWIFTLLHTSSFFTTVT